MPLCVKELQQLPLYFLLIAHKHCTTNGKSNGDWASKELNKKSWVLKQEIKTQWIFRYESFVANTAHLNNLPKLWKVPHKRVSKLQSSLFHNWKSALRISFPWFALRVLHKGNEMSSQGCSGCLNTLCKAITNLCRKAKCQQQKTRAKAPLISELLWTLK